MMTMRAYDDAEDEDVDVLALLSPLVFIVKQQKPS